MTRRARRAARRQERAARAEQRWAARYFPQVDDDPPARWYEREISGPAAVAGGLALFVLLIGYAAGLQLLTGGPGQ